MSSTGSCSQNLQNVALLPGLFKLDSLPLKFSLPQFSSSESESSETDPPESSSSRKGRPFQGITTVLALFPVSSPSSSSIAVNTFHQRHADATSSNGAFRTPEEHPRKECDEHTPVTSTDATPRKGRRRPRKPTDWKKAKIPHARLRDLDNGFFFSKSFPSRIIR